MRQQGPGSTASGHPGATLGRATTPTLLKLTSGKGEVPLKSELCRLLKFFWLVSFRDACELSRIRCMRTRKPVWACPCGLGRACFCIDAPSFLEKRFRAFSRFPGIHESHGKKPRSGEEHTLMVQKRTLRSPLLSLEQLSPGCQPTFLLQNPEALKRDHRGKK